MLNFNGGMVGRILEKIPTARGLTVASEFASAIARSAVRIVTLLALLIFAISACNPFSPLPSTPKQSRFVHKTESPRALVIFIHGVFGDSEGTWRNGRTSAYWPDLLAGDSDFSVYYDVFVASYGSPLVTTTSNIEEIAQRLLQQFSDRGLWKYDQVFIVAHSMGGLITKRMLIDLNTQDRASELQHVKAVVFLSTPSQGAPIADVASWISVNPQLKDMRPSDLNTFLQTLENQWQDVLRGRDHRRDVAPQAYCAYETIPTGPMTVVTRLYSTSRCDNTPYGIDLDHSEIVKPADRDTDPYPWVKSRILQAAALNSIESALPTITPRKIPEPKPEEPIIVATAADVAKASTYNAKGNEYWKQAVGSSSWDAYSKQMAAALDTYKVAESIHPTNALYAINVGTALNRLNRYEEASAKLSRGVKLDPTVAWYHNELCLSFARLRRFQEAEPECRTAVRLDPRDAEFQSQLEEFLKEAEKQKAKP